MSSVYDRLEQLQTIGIKLGLHNISAVLKQLGNPHQAYPSVLIAGTNGKGSVTAMLEQIFLEHGLTTASYTSPHLIDLKERIKVNQEMISSEELESCLRDVFAATDALELEGTPTYFETMTAAALLHFQRKNVNVAVLEVGMGGRFDATNIVTPKVSVITSIDFDHEEFLGRSLAQIATEKAGIIKHGVPVVIGPLFPEAENVIRQTAEKNASTVVAVDPDDIANASLVNGFPLLPSSWIGRSVRINLRGLHQAQNAAAVLKVCETLSEFPLNKEVIVQALEKVFWPGRLQVLRDHPIFLLDCAHNPMGVRSLSSFLQQMKWFPAIGLFTAMRDKKITPMLKGMSTNLKQVILTRVEPFQRCASVEQLTHEAKAAGVNFEMRENFSEAAQHAANLAIGNNIALVIFGSIYLAGEALNCNFEDPSL